MSCPLRQAADELLFILAPHMGGADYFASIVVSGELHNAGVMAQSPQRTKSHFVLVQVELEGRGQRVLQSQDTVFFFSFFFFKVIVQSKRGLGSKLYLQRLASTVDTGYTHSTARQVVGIR